MKLIEILPELLSGKKICHEAWDSDEFIYHDVNLNQFSEEDGQEFKFVPLHFIVNEGWKLFEEKKEEREIELLRKKFQVQSESIQIINKENHELNEKISELKNKILKLETEKRISEYHQNTSYPTWREIQERMKPMLHCTLGY